MSGWPSISADGRFVVFWSASTNLWMLDTNGFDDVFLHDRLTRRTRIVSLTSTGGLSDGNTRWSVVSRYAGTVVMATPAALVSSDTNGAWDVYARRCVLPTTYCTPKTNSLGCTPAISVSGVPTIGTVGGFTLGAMQVLNQRMGMLVYSVIGPASTPFGGGWICMQRPTRRTPPQGSGGSTFGSDCTGTHAIDFNAHIASGLDPSLVVGTTAWAQWWTRDPGFAVPNNLGLTDAATFVIWP